MRFSQFSWINTLYIAVNLWLISRFLKKLIFTISAFGPFAFMDFRRSLLYLQEYFLKQFCKFMTVCVWNLSMHLDRHMTFDSHFLSLNIKNIHYLWHCVIINKNLITILFPLSFKWLNYFDILSNYFVVYFSFRASFQKKHSGIIFPKRYCPFNM